MSLDGKIAIVTGAAGGIGQAIAVELAKRGAKVLATDIRDEADETMRLIQEAGGCAAYFRADMREEKDHIDLFAFCKRTFGVPNLYIANGGLNGMTMFEQITMEEFDRFFETNVRGTFLGFKQIDKEMEAGSKVIVISSSSIEFPVAGMSVYAATKAAVGAMVDVLAIEWAKKGITINAVLPGVTATKEALQNLPKAHLDNVAATTPLGRVGTPEDIAKTVAMLCTSDSDWLTGQHIVANGGAAF